MVRPTCLSLGKPCLTTSSFRNPIFEHGLLCVFLRDTDGSQQDGFCRKRAIRHLRPALHVFVPREFHRGFSRGARLISDRFIGGPQLGAIEDALDGGEICVLTRDQHSAPLSSSA